MIYNWSDKKNHPLLKILSFVAEDSRKTSLQLQNSLPSAQLLSTSQGLLRGPGREHGYWSQLHRSLNITSAVCYLCDLEKIT